MSLENYGTFHPDPEWKSPSAALAVILSKMLQGFEEFLETLLVEYGQWKWLWSLTESRVRNLPSEGAMNFDFNQSALNQLASLEANASRIYQSAIELYELQCANSHHTKEANDDDDEVNEWIINEEEATWFESWLQMLQDRNQSSAKYIAWWIGLTKWFEAQLDDESLECTKTKKDGLRRKLHGLIARLENLVSEAKPLQPLLCKGDNDDGDDDDEYEDDEQSKYSSGRRMLRARKSHYCSKCSKKFTYRIELVNHEESVHGTDRKRYQCSVCGIGFARHGNLVKHHNRVHVPEEQQEMQQEALNQMDTYEDGEELVPEEGGISNHYSTTPTISILYPNPQRHQCSVCGMGFRRYGNMIKHHERIHSAPRKEQEAVNLRSTEQNGSKDVEIIGEKAIGNDLATPTTKPASTVSIVYPIVTPEAAQIKLFYQPLAESSGQQEDGSSSNSSIPQSTANQCPECSQCFPDQTHLYEHMSVHTNPRPFECETCGQCFRKKTHLSRHTERRHNPNRTSQTTLQDGVGGDDDYDNEQYSDQSETENSLNDIEDIIRNDQSVGLTMPIVTPIDPSTAEPMVSVVYPVATNNNGAELDLYLCGSMEKDKQ